ncbi:hypothetical protein QBC40DRAFT_1752 [Triangularia verruculosa]|uniref:Leucine rich repeat domain containing protein n=1 Tax=Triangularia verruculosa TaxID=2587418 RepID=A0AAN6XS45_9PEZI|nr:hypothetical protein QBC40DRAFT_1752 [Triangularia verruculosa]
MDNITRIAAAANPPSYQEATRHLDWVELIAPYVPIREYARLCLVNRRFYRHLAPRLWNDPLATASTGRPASRDIDLEWFYRFMEHMQHVRQTTRHLVTCLDLRAVEVGTSELSLYSLSRSFSAYLRMVRVTFPQLRCILLNRHWDVEADDLAVATTPGSNAEGPLMLSIPQCQVKVPTVFFSSPYLCQLVYLDMSGMAGSLRKSLEQRTFGPERYPDLRILKVGAREMGDSTAALLARRFKQQLWSLDLSKNELTDAVLDDLHICAFAAGSLRTARHFDVEGRFEIIGNQRTPLFGLIRESQWSATFNHPDRYLVDAPDYTRSVADTAPEHVRTRSNGQEQIQHDSEDEIRKLLSGSIRGPPPDREYVRALDVCQSHNGLTHLYLNGNSLTASGLVRLIMSSPGQLQRLECDSVVYDMHEAAKPEWLSSNMVVSGLLGAAHVFRPVLSSNLQVLRIHHSLVTQLLSLKPREEGGNGWGLSSMENLWLAEMFLLPRAEMAYPQAFVPDMNPRLRVLILSHIPRWSTGPLIDKLINLLKLASMQERAIQDLSQSRRGPFTVSGLRHIRLEFDYDCREELLMGDSQGDDEEEKETANSSEELAAKNFSFFDESRFMDFSFDSSEVSSPNINTATAINTDTTPLASGAGPAADDHRAVLDNNRSQNERHAPSSSSTLLHLPRTGDTSELTLNGGNEDESARLTTGPQQQQEQQQQTVLPNDATLSVADSSTASWNGTEYTVWAGPPPSPPPIYSTEDTPQQHEHQRQQQKLSPAVKAYMHNILDERLCTDARPASPCHVLAGVPEGEFVWSAAWQAIVTRGDNSVRKPKKRELLNGMRDVVEEIKAFRRGTRARYEEALKRARQNGEEVKLGEPHFYYRGLLQVVTALR